MFSHQKSAGLFCVFILFAGLLLSGCNKPQEQAGPVVRKPVAKVRAAATTRTIPAITARASTATKEVPAAPQAAAARKTSHSLTVPALPKPATQETSPTLVRPNKPPKGISAEAARVFQEMDAKFADSKSRHVEIVSRLVMNSSVKGFRSSVTLEMKVLFPNRLAVTGRTVTETNDPQTTITWNGGQVNWAVTCDGKNMLLRKDKLLFRDDPLKSLDDGLKQPIILEGWGETPMIDCFFSSRPSQVFRPLLRRAEVVERTDREIRLKLVTRPTAYLMRRSGIPAATNIVQRITIDAKTLIPKRCYIDLLDVSNDTYKRRFGPATAVAVEEAYLEIRVTRAEMNADFSGSDPFLIAGSLLKQATSLSRGRSSSGPRPSP